VHQNGVEPTRLIGLKCAIASMRPLGVSFGMGLALDEVGSTCASAPETTSGGFF
jgi:hypothetical protein